MNAAEHVEIERNLSLIVRVAEDGIGNDDEVAEAIADRARVCLSILRGERRPPVDSTYQRWLQLRALGYVP